MAIDVSQDIRDRTFRFGCEVARLALGLDARPGVRSLVDQLLRAGTAIGANLEEAKAASSKREFLRYLQISLRESREAVYWIRMCSSLQLVQQSGVRELLGEGDQISRILGAIVVTTKRRILAGYLMFAFCILNFALILSS
jgi:four helix bundle protein